MLIYVWHLKNDNTNYNRNNMNTIWIGLEEMCLESYSLTLCNKLLHINHKTLVFYFVFTRQKEHGCI